MGYGASDVLLVQSLVEGHGYGVSLCPIIHLFSEAAA
jgi:hypothetical protein